MRMIDVDALGVGRCSKDVLPEAYCAGWNGLIDLIEKAPTIDAVPVVCCRECKYSSYDEIFGNRWCNSHLGCRKVKDDGYCYLGERKEGAD